jgi:uncharacterized alkaline shock family protein YloU
MKKFSNPFEELGAMDPKELHLPETTMIHDIETKFFQSITLQAIKKIDGVEIAHNSLLIENLLGSDDKISGVFVEQDQKKHEVSIKVEVNIRYGMSIPEKAEQIQMQVVKDVSSLTGVHVSMVHVIFKNIIENQAHPRKEMKQQEEAFEGFL